MKIKWEDRIYFKDKLETHSWKKIDVENYSKYTFADTDYKNLISDRAVVPENIYCDKCGLFAFFSIEYKNYFFNYWVEKRIYNLTCNEVIICEII